MTRNDYWAERARLDKLKVIKTGEHGINNLKKLLLLNIKDVEKKIKDFYEKYGDEGKYAENLSYSEFEKYKAKLKRMAKKYPQDKTIQKIAKQDIPKYRIDRLRALQTDLQAQLTEATAGQEAGIYKTLDDVGKVAQATTAARLKGALGLEFNTISARKMQKILSSDWSGATWSDRLWKDREVVGKKVTNILEKGIPQGTSLQTMSRELKQATGQSFNDAFRLIRTETSHIDGQVTLDSFKQAQEELGIQYYIYDAFLDNRTSSICRDLNGKRFRIDKAEVGENYPPMHPNCRSTVMLDENSVVEIEQEEKQTKEEKKEEPKETELFTPAKNYKEAEEFAKDLGFENAEYKGLDVNIANRMNKVYAQYKNDYPEIMEEMRYTGSSHNLYAFMKNNVYTRDFCLNNLKANNPNVDFSKMSDASLNAYIVKQQNFLLKSFRVNKDTIASSWRTKNREIYEGIVYNSKAKYSEEIKKLAQQVAAENSPRGTASIEGIIEHEMGHRMDKLLNLRENTEIQKIFNSMTQDELTKKVSRYSWKNRNKNKYAEFIAEAWSEYKTSKKPREIALKVGQIIEKEYKKLH